MFQGKTNSCTIQKKQTSVCLGCVHSLSLTGLGGRSQQSPSHQRSLAACQQLETQRFAHRSAKQQRGRLPAPSASGRAAKNRREPRATREGPLGGDLQAVRGQAGRLAGSLWGSRWEGLGGPRRADQGTELGFSVKPPEGCSLGHHKVRLRQDLSGEGMEDGVAEAERCWGAPAASWTEATGWGE